jgi:hypothetical protein
MKQTCQQIFQNALNERLEYPLHEGIYKLKEGRNSLRSTLEEIQTIAALKRNEVENYQLQQCQPSEIASWLRSVPSYLAHVLGRTVLPAFGALTADGVPPYVVARLEAAATAKIECIIADLDNAQRILANPIREEYARMKWGSCTLTAPILAALEVIASAIGPSTASQDADCNMLQAMAAPSISMRSML